MCKTIQLVLFEFAEHIFTGQPCTFVCDADLHDLILSRIKHRQHGACGHQRDLMLTGSSTKQDCHVKFSLSHSTILLFLCHSERRISLLMYETLPGTPFGTRALRGETAEPPGRYRSQQALPQSDIF